MSISSRTLTPAEWQAARKEFEDAGLKIMSGGNVDMTKDTTIEQVRHHFEYAKHTGMPMMVCAPTHDNIKMVRGDGEGVQHPHRDPQSRAGRQAFPDAAIGARRGSQAR